jgi:hypothetical protein
LTDDKGYREIMLSFLLSSKMRVPLLTAIAVAGIVIYLISIHREVVTHNAKITELNESVQMLQQILHCCPPASSAPLSVPVPVSAPEPAAIPAPARVTEATVATPGAEELLHQEEQFELASVGSAELRNMLDIIGECDEEDVVLQQDDQVGEAEAEAEADASASVAELNILTCADADLESITYHRLKNLLKSNNINNKGTREVLLERAREFRKSTNTTC